MYIKKIFDLAHEAIELQNKDRMDAALKEIRDISWVEYHKTYFEDLRIEKWGSEPCPECMKPRARRTPVDTEPTATHFKVETPFDGVSTKALWPATKEFFDAKYQNEPASAPSSTGLVHVKMEGGAVHPDDIGATMNEEQYARQLAAHERDVAAGGPADDAANAMAEVAGVVNRKPGKKGASK